MKKNRALYAVFFVSGAMILAGVLLLAAYHLRGYGAHRKTATAVPTSKIATKILLRPLLGEAPSRSVKLAIERGELEVAAAILENSPFMSRKDQLGLRLSLASKFASGREFDEAARLYDEGAAIAFLSPAINDQYRAQALLEIGSGLAGIKHEKEAKVCLRGVEKLIYDSPHFQPAQRLQLLDRAKGLYARLGIEQPTKSLPEKFVPVQPLPLSLQVMVPPDIPKEFFDVEAQRRKALQTALASPTDENWGKVIHAFLKEDQVKESIFSSVLSSEPQLAARVSWLRERAVWRWTKYSIARKAYGISLVPQWEKALPDVKFKLVKAYEDMYAGYGDMAISLPTPEEVEVGWTIVLRNELLDAWLGYYPNAPMSAIENRLKEHSGKLSGKWKEELCPVLNMNPKSPLPFEFVVCGEKR